MSSVQEIEAALSHLSRQDLEAIEKRIAEFKQQWDEEHSAYSKQEYGVTDEELKSFDERMKAHNAEALKKGETTVFPGKFDPACLD